MPVNVPSRAGVSAEAMLATIADLVALAPRAPGTPGGEQSADYVAQRLRSAGLPEVWIEETPTFVWSASAHDLVVGGERVTSTPVSHCLVSDHEQTGPAGTGPDGVTAPVVDIGARRIGTRRGDVAPADVAGRVVLFDLVFEVTNLALLPTMEWLHDPDRRLLNREFLNAGNPYLTNLTRVMTAAAEAGAVGVVGVLRDYPESTSYHNEYYRRSTLPLPGAWVTRSTGDHLRRRLADGPLDATLVLETRREQVTARTVLGRLPGRTRETVMVQSHHDSIGPGAVEDASGTAEVIALAEHFAARAATGEVREKTLLFTLFDSHFTGYHAHRDFARRWILDPDAPDDIVLNLTIEHVGLAARRGADGGFEVTGTTEPRAIFENVNPRLKLDLVRLVRRHEVTATCLLNASLTEFTSLGVPTDASFVLTSGVPIISLVSGPLYLYDAADTVDKVDVDQLEPVGRLYADLVDLVDRRPGQRLGLVPTRLRRLLPRGRW
jgi:hypothetical protein